MEPPVPPPPFLDRSPSPDISPLHSKSESVQSCQCGERVGSLPQDEQLADEWSRVLREKRKPMHRVTETAVSYLKHDGGKSMEPSNTRVNLFPHMFKSLRV